LKTKSKNSLLDQILDVKILAELEPEIEATRPSCCAQCGVEVGMPGALNIHGHGLRERLVLGPTEPQALPEAISVYLRRFRCIACGHVMTVRPAILARYFLYSTAAIALALWLWATVQTTQSTVRALVSPWTARGPSEADRWRSLRRWVGRAGDVLGLPEHLHGETARAVAARVAGLLVGRAPPGLSERARAFVGAQTR